MLKEFQIQYTGKSMLQGIDHLTDLVRTGIYRAAANQLDSTLLFGRESVSMCWSKLEEELSK